MLSEVTSYHHALQTVVFRVAFVAHMPVRTKNRSLGQGAAQAFGYFLLGEPAISAKGHVQVILPVCRDKDIGLVLGYATRMVPSAPCVGSSVPITIRYSR